MEESSAGENITNSSEGSLKEMNKDVVANNDSNIEEFTRIDQEEEELIANEDPNSDPTEGDEEIIVDPTEYLEIMDESVDAAEDSDNDKSLQNLDFSSGSGDAECIKSKPFSCNLCGKSVTSKGSLKQHMMLHTGERPFACDKCEKSFNQKSHLQRHQKLHTEQIETFPCAVCEFVFNRKDRWSAHMRIHTGESKYSCDVCGREFTQKENWLNHQSVHTGIKPHECDLCDKSFTKNYQLTAHKKIHTRVFTCPICDQSFNRMDVLTSHQRIHTDEKVLPCYECGKTFKRKDVLYLHQKLHSGNKPHVCKTCGKSFAQKDKLTRHEKIHTGIKPFSCNICGNTYTRNDSLTRHLSVVHGQNSESIAESSDYVDFWSDSIQQEIKEEPIAESDIKDSVHKETTTVKEEKNELLIDNDTSKLTTYTDEEELACDQCGRSFSCHTKLIRHQQTHNIYTCNICDKSFVRKDRLKAHELTHGEKAFSCVECGKAFSRKDALKRHYILVHDITVSYENMEGLLKTTNNAKNNIKEEKEEQPFNVSDIKEEIKEEVVDKHQVFMAEK